MKAIYIVLFNLVFLFSTALEAKLVQILHTNDIHSYFDHVEHDEDQGGYARLKAMIEFYKAEAAKKGIRTIVVDAGDFMEGNFFYMAKNGRRSFEMHNKLGYDISVIGNHDYLMGTDEMDSILKDVNPEFKYLGANFYADSRYKGINKHVKPYHEMTIEGVKVAFLGLTTDEIVFRWRVYNGGIRKPLKDGEKFDKILKERGNEVIIGLTHIGFEKDKKLASKTKNIDLIIGGHSHDFLYKPHYEKNKNKKQVPIVQAGAHAAVLGRMIIDIEKTGFKGIKEYELVPIRGIKEDQDIADAVEVARTDLEEQYGRDHLYEEVGFSHLEPGDDAKIWNAYTTDAVLESTGSDVSIHTPSMGGPYFPVGSVTRYDLYNSHPRWFDFNDEEGWFVYRATIKGFWIKWMFKAVMNLGIPLTFSGIDFEWKKNIFGKYTVKNLRIKGKKIKSFKNYELALPEGIVRGGFRISPLVGLLLKKAHRTPVTVVGALEKKLSSGEPIDKYYLEEPKFELFGKKKASSKRDRVFFPGNKR
ncbi:MAG: 2',3'-cyclic-nucleotide 2'-phosphodiesterase (5'-nucleotidase family) [Bacteriovoracaceae bacterium]|jgi:2',3'-cyclic-nucleotide 2'-phosphodiesterase (5'-nucleotidase family)